MSDKKILLWGALPSLPAGESYKQSYERSGLNFGNTLIGNGVVSVLSNCEYIYRHELTGPCEANEKCDHIVIPAANFLWKGFDFGYMADFISSTNLPVTIVGLGAQTHDRSMVSPLHPNTLRLVKIISERSPSLAVRGFYTAEVLASNGILNLEILGCPSLYTNLIPPSGIVPLSEDDIHNSAVNFSRQVSVHSFSPPSLQKIENVLIGLAMRLKLPFIAQDEIEELDLAYGVSNDASSARIANYFRSCNLVDVRDYFENNSNYFRTYDDWAGFVRKRSGTIGSRLHGNIISLINGRPGLVFAHDSRTLEMCALTGIPYLHIKDTGLDLINEVDLIALLTSLDFSVFESNMKILFDRYKKFLDSHLLPNRL